jgi:hypothetical protein
MILDRADTAIAQYNRGGKRFDGYNRAAGAVYRARETRDPFSVEYELHIVKGLIAFGMGRTMGAGDKYEANGAGFRASLRSKLRGVRERLQDVPLACLRQIELASFDNAIKEAYGCLAASGEGALHGNPEKQFHVGATKILHWIAPALFIIMDRNVASALQAHHAVGFAKGTLPGYTAERYFSCLLHAQTEIEAYGYERFRRLEPATPLARVFDKVAFVAGKAGV